MTTITARTTSQYFGEPLYLGEITKKLVAAALNIDRSELRFVHEKNTDEAPKAVIELSIDAVGDASVSEGLEAAFHAVTQSRNLTFSISFTGGNIENDMGFIDTSAALDKAVEAARAQNSTIVEYHSHNAGPSYGDYAGESGEYYDWQYNKILNEK